MFYVKCFYLRDPGLTIHYHQVTASALSPLYKTQLVTLSVMLHGFPNNLLAKWVVWVLKDRSNSELDARFVLTNRIACQNTLWGLAWVNQFTEERDPVLLSVLWEKRAIWIGPGMLCLTKVPVCMCVWPDTLSYLPLPLQLSHDWPERDKKPQCPSWTSTDKGCHTREWDVCAVWIGNEFPWFHVLIALLSDVVDVAFASFPTSAQKENLTKTFISFLILSLIRDAPSRS